MIFDVTDRESFESVRSWINEIEKYSKDGVCKLLIGNKIDLTDKRKVTYNESLELGFYYKGNI